MPRRTRAVGDGRAGGAVGAHASRGADAAVRAEGQIRGCCANLHSSTEMRFILCTWLGEISSFSFLSVLPGPA